MLCNSLIVSFYLGLDSNGCLYYTLSPLSPFVLTSFSKKYSYAWVVRQCSFASLPLLCFFAEEKSFTTVQELAL